MVDLVRKSWNTILYEVKNGPRSSRIFARDRS